MSPTAATSVALLAGEQLPEDVGKGGPVGLLLTVLLLLAAMLLVRSMTGHLKRLPPSFDEPAPVVPDTPAELLEPSPPPGQEILDSLRRAPRAIEGPTTDDRRTDGGRTDQPPRG